MGKVWMGLLLAFMGGVASAEPPADVSAKAELSMRVAGTLELAADGSVTSWQVDEPDRLPDAVVDLVDRAAPAWRFEPLLVDGQPVASRVRASLRLVATQDGDESYSVSIRSAHFSDPDLEGQPPRIRRPPDLPASVVRLGAQGAVHLVLKVSRDGKVQDAVVEQVNLRTVGSARQMDEVRADFARAVLPSARTWRLSAQGAEERGYTVARMVVDFVIGKQAPDRSYGKWEAYIPGPRHRAPWAGDEVSPDALASGGIYTEGAQRRLLTPLQPG